MIYKDNENGCPLYIKTNGKSAFFHNDSNANNSFPQCTSLLVDLTIVVHFQLEHGENTEGQIKVGVLYMLFNKSGCTLYAV